MLAAMRVRRLWRTAAARKRGWRSTVRSSIFRRRWMDGWAHLKIMLDGWIFAGEMSIHPSQRLLQSSQLVEGNARRTCHANCQCSYCTSRYRLAWPHIFVLFLFLFFICWFEQNSQYYTVYVCKSKEQLARNIFSKKKNVHLRGCKQKIPRVPACQLNGTQTASRPAHLGGPFGHNNSSVQES